MHSRSHKVLSLVITLLAISLALDASLAPAQAATASLYVDNSLPLCKAGAHPTIAAALAAAPAANVKITICPGTYPTGPLTISGKTNFKVIGKKGAVLTPNVAAFGSSLLIVSNSTNVTVQGLTIDGLNTVASTGNYSAIVFSQSSGTIQKNTVVNWHSTSYPSLRIANSITVVGSVGEAVKITHNTLPDVDQAGINIFSLVAVNVTGNKITSTGISGTGNGILLTNGVTGSVSGNKITGNGFPVGSSAFIGISLNGVSGMSIKSNSVTGATVGISIMGSIPPTNSNLIKGNKLYEVNVGINLNAFGITGPASADNNTITGNKIVNKLAPGTIGIQVNSDGMFFPPTFFGTGSAQNEVVIKNTITHFASGVIHTTGPYGNTTGTFDPNKYKP